MLKKIILCIVLIILGLSLVSCQTFEGLGGDIQWTARKGAEMLEGKKVEENQY